MLEDWITQIRQEEQHYKIDSWKYRVAGNVMELSVRKSNIKDKQIYRLSIITIGQVLRAISCKIEASDSHFLIQSLPDLENPEIIASIRMDLNSYHRDTFPPCNSGDKNLPLLLRLEKLSHLYQFSLIRTSEPAEQFIPENLLNINYCWYALTSKFDNPFTWLNLGYWKESILRNCRGDYDLQSALYIDFCPTSHTERVDHTLQENQKLQALIAVNENLADYSKSFKF